MFRRRLVLLAGALTWALAGCPLLDNAPPTADPANLPVWVLSTDQGGLDEAGRFELQGRFCPQPEGAPPSGIVGRFRADAPSGAQVRFDPPSADTCTDVRITVTAPGFAGSMRIGLVVELSSGSVPFLQAALDLQGAVPAAGCTAPPTAADRWRAVSAPLALDARTAPALRVIDDLPVLARVNDDTLVVHRLERATRRWLDTGTSFGIYRGASFLQFVGGASGVDLAWLGLDGDGTLMSLFVHRWDAQARQFSATPLTAPVLMTQPRALQLQRTAESLFALAVDGSTLQLRVWRLPHPKPRNTLFEAVTLPAGLADSRPYALATDVDAQGRLLIALDRLVQDENGTLTQIELWRQVGVSGFERLGPAVEAQRARGPFDVPVIQDLSLRATDPSSGRSLVLAWTQGGVDEGQRVMDWRAGDAAWAPLGDWAAGVQTEPLPYGRSSQGRSLALDCSGVPIMGWGEAGSAYPTTLAWAAAYTGQGASGWFGLPAIPPADLPSPGRLQLVDRPGQRPMALRWHLGGWGDEARVDVLSLEP